MVYPSMITIITNCNNYSLFMTLRYVSQKATKHSTLIVSEQCD